MSLTKVSIPYEREGISKVDGETCSIVLGGGVVYPKVSIPYEREGISKGRNPLRSR
jgi:hypothetical protein